MSSLGTLVTVANPREALKNSAAARDYDIPLVVDSGAWSNFTGKANVTVTSHIAYLRENSVAGARHVALDVIGNAEQSFANWKAERLAGLDVEPTIHYGTDPSIIDRYLAEGLATPWVNLGGMAHLQGRRDLHRSLAAWSAAVMRRCPTGTLFHGLGAITPALNKLIRLDAVDSTYWLDVMKFGMLRLFDETTGEWIRMSVSKRSARFKAGQYQRIGVYGPTIKRLYGVSGSDIVEMPMPDLISLTFDSHQRFAVYYEERYGHTMTVFLAGSTKDHFDLINKKNEGKP